MDKYRNESVASQKQIKQLEQLNMDLQKTATTGGYGARFASKDHSKGSRRDYSAINKTIKQIIDLKISM